MTFDPICRLSSDTLSKTLGAAGLDAVAVLARETAEGVHLLNKYHTPEASSRNSREFPQVSAALPLVYQAAWDQPSAVIFAW